MLTHLQKAILQRNCTPEQFEFLLSFSDFVLSEFYLKCGFSGIKPDDVFVFLNFVLFNTISNDRTKNV